MPTLTECGEQIRILKDEKGFHADIFFFKLVWGQIELAEAIDLVKKNGLPPNPHGITSELHHETNAWKIGEEITDVVFYMADAYSLLRHRYPWLPTMDDMFNWKMQKNMKRPRRYGQQWMDDFFMATIDHYHNEGILESLVVRFNDYAKKKLLERARENMLKADVEYDVVQEPCTCRGGLIYKSHDELATCEKCEGKGFTTRFEPKSAE